MLQKSFLVQSKSETIAHRLQVRTKKEPNTANTRAVLHERPSFLAAAKVSAAGLLSSVHRTRVRIVTDRIGVEEEISAQTEGEMKISNDGWSKGRHMPMARFSLKRSKQLLRSGHTLTGERKRALVCVCVCFFFVWLQELRASCGSCM